MLHLTVPLGERRGVSVVSLPEELAFDRSVGPFFRDRSMLTGRWKKVISVCAKAA